ncbi:MAG: hypothetical protein KY443_01325 [Actinobacteria bacterium]|nr:hypothetical protein [Actinomycetota bacterium]
MNRTSDPTVAALVTLLLLCGGGAVALWLGWRGVAANWFVPSQVAFVVSGAMGAGALVGLGVGLFAIQTRRVAEARRRAEWATVVEAAGALLATAREQQGAWR